MRLCWVVYAWVTHPTLKRGVEFSQSWGEIEIPWRQGSMRRENSLWEDSHSGQDEYSLKQNLMLPTKVKRGEENEFMRNELVRWGKPVYQNLPLAARSHFHSCRGEPVNTPSAYKETPAPPPTPPGYGMCVMSAHIWWILQTSRVTTTRLLGDSAA